MAMISDLLEARQARRAAEARFHDETQDAWPVVLIVEHSPALRQILERTLQRERVRVLGVGEGQAALAALVPVAPPNAPADPAADSAPAAVPADPAPAAVTPHLVLLNTTLPDLSGYAVCKAIKREAQTKHLPVVLLGERAGWLARLRGRLAGCSQFIAKPLDLDELAKLVARHVSSTRQPAPPSPVPDAPDGQGETMLPDASNTPDSDCQSSETDDQMLGWSDSRALRRAFTAFAVA